MKKIRVAAFDAKGNTTTIAVMTLRKPFESSSRTERKKYVTRLLKGQGYEKNFYAEWNHEDFDEGFRK